MVELIDVLTPAMFANEKLPSLIAPKVVVSGVTIVSRKLELAGVI